jgi:hypothetical protein
MKLVFVDEVEQPQKAPGFFGIGAFIVTSTFYRGLRDDVDDAFEDANWDRDKEFKGRYLFSSSKGDTSVGIDARIELTQTIVKGDHGGEERSSNVLPCVQLRGAHRVELLSACGTSPAQMPKTPK